jgi:IS30 family transposase
VAIERATRWVFVQITSNNTAASAKSSLKALHNSLPDEDRQLLTDDGKELSHRLFATRERQPTGHHAFDRVCSPLGIER